MEAFVCSQVKSTFSPRIVVSLKAIEFKFRNGIKDTTPSLKGELSQRTSGSVNCPRGQKPKMELTKMSGNIHNGETVSETNQRNCPKTETVLETNQWKCPTMETMSKTGIEWSGVQEQHCVIQ